MNINDSITSSQIENDKVSQEILYLIFKYLSHYGGFEQTIDSFQTELNNGRGSLGRIFRWDGEIRDATIEDMNKMFGNISGNHLNHILRNTIQSAGHPSTDHPSVTTPVSLLSPIDRLFLQSSITKQQECKENLESIKSILQSIASLKSKRCQYITRRNELVSLVLQDHSKEVNFIEEGNTTLRQIGQNNEYQHLTVQIQLIESEIIDKNVEKAKLLRQISIHDGLFSESRKGKISTLSTWLINRTLGICSFNQSLGTGISRTVGISSSALSTKLQTNYELQWTISGHMLNPAYCVVFDKTGEYIITGADDFLVKVWNIRKGLLVHTLKGHQAYISLIEVSPDNSIVASACTNGIIRLWNLSDGRCLKVLNHGGSVNWIKFDELSFVLASAGDDGNCVVWDLTKILYQQSLVIDTSLDHISMINILTEENFSSDQSHVHQHNSSPDLSISATTIATIMDSDDVEDSVFLKHVNTSKSLSSSSSSSTLSSHSLSLRNFDGLFSWSNVNKGGDLSGRLVLSHLHDSFQLGGGNEVIKIHCLDISPIGDVLITGCEDGIARVWKFSDHDENERKTRSNQTQAELALNALKGLVSPHEYQRMEFIASHLLQRLEGHVSGITDTRFSNLGDRVVTGSLNDGTVRIWSFNRNYTKNEHVVLILKDDEDDSDVILSDRIPNSRRTSRKQLKTEAFNVAWTCDDTKVITLQSTVTPTSFILASSNTNKELLQPTRLKVWDSFTGDLLRIIPSVGQVACKLLSTHPTLPAIVVTCGMDGLINIWNIEYESKVCSHKIFDVDTITSSHLVDASFSPDGQYLAVTDIIGRLTLLGLEKIKSSDHLHPYFDQYFSSDYSDFILDVDGNAIDIGTQLPMHQAPRGLLCRIDGYAYDNQPPTISGPKPYSKEYVRIELMRKRVNREHVRKVMDKTFTFFQKNRLRNRQPKYTSWSSILSSSGEQNNQETRQGYSRGNGHSHDGSNNNNNSNSLFRRETRSSSIYSLDNSHDRRATERAVQYLSSDDSSDNIDYYTSQVNVLRSGRMTRPVERLDPENGESYHTTREMRNEMRENRAVRRAARRNNSRNSVSSRQLTVVESDDDDEFEANDYENSDTDSEDSSLHDSDDDSDDEEEDNDDSDEDDDDQEDGNDNENEEDEDNMSEGGTMTRRVSKRLRQQKKEMKQQKKQKKQKKKQKRLLRKRQHIRDELNNNLDVRRSSRRSNHNNNHKSSNDSSSAIPRSRALKNTMTQSPLIGWGILHRGKKTIAMDADVDRLWLQEDRTFDSQYAPQLGDTVIYFPQGHIEMLREFAENSRPPWQSFSHKWPLVECKVKDISYEFPSRAEHRRCQSIIVIMTLVIVSIPLKPQLTSSGEYHVEFVPQRHTRQSANIEPTSFKVTIRNCNLPDFLVPSHIFNRCLRIPWHEGIKVNVVYREPILAMNNNNSSNTVATTSATSNSTSLTNPTTYERQEREYSAHPDSAPIENIAPWEAIPILDTSKSYAKAIAKYPCPSIPNDVSIRILYEIRTLMEENSELYDPFAYEVDSTVFPEYYCTIPVPIYVDLICRRLENKYYRQIEALEFDIDQIYDNCVSFNDDGANITKDAARLRDDLHRVIWGEHDGVAINPPTNSEVVIKSSSSSSSGALTVPPTSKSSSSSTTTTTKRTSGKVIMNESSDNPMLRLSRTAKVTSYQKSNEEQDEVEEEAELDDVVLPENIRPRRSSRSRLDNNSNRSSSNNDNDNDSSGIVTTDNIHENSKVSRNREESNQFILRLSNRRAQVEQQAPQDSSRRSSRIATDHLQSIVSRNTTMNSNNRLSTRLSSLLLSSSSNPLTMSVNDTRRSTRKSIQYYDKNSSDDMESYNEAIPTSVRRTLRTRKTIRKRYMDDDDENKSFSNSHDHNQDSEDEDQDNDNNNRNRRNNRENGTFVRRSKRSRRSIKYEDPESDVDFYDEKEQKDEEEEDRNDEYDIQLSSRRSTRVLFSKESKSIRSEQHLNGRKSEDSTHSSSNDKTKSESKRMDPDLKRKVLKLLFVVEEADVNKVFAEPITDDIVPGYSSVISVPMDLSTIRENFGKRQYDTIQEVVDDLELMFENCLTFNDPRSIYAKEAKRLRKLMLSSLSEIN